MIPRIHLEQWKKQAPWKTQEMVEHDLIISRALIELYNSPIIRENLVFRGGTALNKIYIDPPARYSEDIDLVQIKVGPIGPIIDAIRGALSEWLGEPVRKITTRSAKLIYKYQNALDDIVKLKLEINTTEHLNILDLRNIDFDVDTAWYKGKTTIPTYYLEELMATKIRALYQRRKGRDLFDLWLVLERNLIDIDLTLDIFYKYNSHNKEVISKKEFVRSFEEKLTHNEFKIDMKLLLEEGINWNFDKAVELVENKIIDRML